MTDLRTTLSRLIFSGQARLRTRLHSALVSRCFHQFGSGSSVVPPLRLEGAEHISIGTGVYVGAGCWLQALRFADSPNPSLVLGDGCTLAGYCTISAASSVVLEPQVLLARNVYIADHRHAFRDTRLPILAQGIEATAPVRICKGAWLGQNVVILPGVTIGTGAVIGANSVVRSDVPAWSVAVGAPARVVRIFGAAGS